MPSVITMLTILYAAPPALTDATPEPALQGGGRAWRVISHGQVVSSDGLGSSYHLAEVCAEGIDENSAVVPTELPVPDEVRAGYVPCAHLCVSPYAHQICTSPCAYELLMMGLVCIHAHCMILAYRCVSIGRAMPSRRSCLICITSSGNTSASHRATPPLQRPSSRPRSLWRAGRGRRRYRARITTLRIRCTKRRPRLNNRTTKWRWHPNIKDTRQWHPNT